MRFSTVGGHENYTTVASHTEAKQEVWLRFTLIIWFCKQTQSMTIKYTVKHAENGRHSTMDKSCQQTKQFANSNQILVTTLNYCKRGNFRMGVIFAFFMLLSS